MAFKGKERYNNMTFKGKERYNNMTLKGRDMTIIPRFKDLTLTMYHESFSGEETNMKYACSGSFQI